MRASRRRLPNSADLAGQSTPADAATVSDGEKGLVDEGSGGRPKRAAGRCVVSDGLAHGGVEDETPATPSVTSRSPRDLRNSQTHIRSHLNASAFSPEGQRPPSACQPGQQDPCADVYGAIRVLSRFDLTIVVRPVRVAAWRIKWRPSAPNRLAGWSFGFRNMPQDHAVRHCAAVRAPTCRP